MTSSPSHITPNSTAPMHTESSVRSGALLARSAFPLAFLALLTLLISLVWLLLSSDSVIYARPAFRSYVLAGYGVSIVLVLVVCGLLLRTRPERLILPARNLAQALSRSWIAVPLTLALVIAAVEFHLALGEIRSDVMALRLWLFGWAAIALIVVVIANWFAFAHWFSQTQAGWAIAGLSLIGLLAIVLVLAVSIQIFDQYVKPVFVAASYATTRLAFEADSGVNAERYWAELNTVRQTRDMPYIGWRSPAFQGEYIHVDEAGVRETASFVKDSKQAGRIFFLGGSTAWGYGARDEYTIPSQLAKTLNEKGCAVEVTNLAENGYASTQDRILFEQQLIKGNLPNAAIFYWGYNDIISAYRWNYLSLPMSGFRGLTDTADMALIGPNAHADPQATVDYLIRTAQMLDMLGQGYGVRILIVWQPTIFFKPLTPYEQEAYERGESGQPGILDFYKQVDALLRASLEKSKSNHFVVMSDLFRQHEETVFIDWAHITEAGNGSVAGELSRQFQQCF